MSPAGRQSTEKLLQGLKDEAERLDDLMDQMVTEMENTPPESRNGDRWDEFTKRFLKLQVSQREVIEKLRDAQASLPGESQAKH
jgi:hypothetical protein